MEDINHDFSTQPLLADPSQHETVINIPAFDELAQVYAQKWEEEKRKFYNQLRENFQGLVSQFRVGRQEIFVLTETPEAKHYERAFRQLFADPKYQATVSETERIGTTSKKVKRLSIVFPSYYAEM